MSEPLKWQDAASITEEGNYYMEATNYCVEVIRHGDGLLWVWKPNHSPKRLDEFKALRLAGPLPERPKS